MEGDWRNLMFITLRLTGSATSLTVKETDQSTEMFRLQTSDLSDTAGEVTVPALVSSMV